MAMGSERCTASHSSPIRVNTSRRFQAGVTRAPAPLLRTRSRTHPPLGGEALEPLASARAPSGEDDAVVEDGNTPIS